MSISSSTGVNRSAAVMSRSGTVDETRRHRMSIVSYRTDAEFFGHPDAPRFYRVAQIGMNRGESWQESLRCD